MSNAFTNFLSSVGSGLSGESSPNMKDYQHASRLYVSNNYARAPKFGHIYFVSFNINDGVVRDASWLQSGTRDVGLLVKKIDLPKFKITTETLNQYNRKTVVQSKLNYEPVSMEFHDDNSEISNGLWKNYYKYYYTDSTYGGSDDNTSKTSSSSLGQKLFGGLQSPGSIGIKGNTETKSIPAAFTDTKYKDKNYVYGLDNLQNKPFFKSIDIYILHQQKFTQITLVNPKITTWEHDSLDQADSKIMRNKMNIAYEDVFYNQGRIGKGTSSGIFAEAYYDNAPSPLSIGGKGTASLFGPGGLVAGASDIFGETGSIAQGNYLAAALQSASLIKNAGQITRASLESAGYSILGTTLGIAATSGNQPGTVGDRLSSVLSQSGIGIYTNQYATSNLTAPAANPVSVVSPLDQAAWAEYYKTVPRQASGAWEAAYGKK